MQFDSSGNVKFINHDIVIPFTSKSTEIYNLACPASPVHYQKTPFPQPKRQCWEC